MERMPACLLVQVLFIRFYDAMIFFALFAGFEWKGATPMFKFFMRNDHL
jgi:hypothetical protein